MFVEATGETTGRGPFLASPILDRVKKVTVKKSKMCQLFYYKMRQKFIKKCYRFFIAKSDSFITKCNCYYKVLMILLQNATIITKRDVYCKMRW